jgi:hypothetical protein
LKGVVVVQLLGPQGRRASHGWSTSTRSSFVGKCRYTVMGDTPTASATSVTVVASYPRSVNSCTACA